MYVCVYVCMCVCWHIPLIQVDLTHASAVPLMRRYSVCAPRVHPSHPSTCLQLHSIGTHHGHALLRNFRDVTLAHTRMRAQQQQRQQQQQQGEEKTSTSVYIERPAAAAARAAAAVDTTIERREGKGARTQVLISRLGSLPGAKGSSSGSSGSGSGKLSERVFRALYGEERTAFWLDSSATATLSASSTTSPAGAVPPKHGGRYSYMGDAAAASGVGGGGKRLGHVLEYYLHTQPSSSSSPSLLRILNGDGAVEERNGAALFPHLQTTLRGMREQGVRMSVAVKDRAWREVAKEELPGLEFWGGYVGCV